MLRDSLLDQVIDYQQQSLCLKAQTQGEQRALAYLCKKGLLISPFPTYYITQEHWDILTHFERIRYIANTYAYTHQNCIFTGLTAADFYQIDHMYSSHHNIPINVLSRTNTTKKLNKPVQRFFCADPRFQTIQGLRIAPIERTIIDCCNCLPLREALPIIDSAVRQGVSIADLQHYCNTLHRDCSQTLRALRYANPKSENGGESFCRGTFIEAGLEIPSIQVTFKIYNMSFRVDFAWYSASGRIIAGELDGEEKYVNPTMTQGKSISAIVQDERERENLLSKCGISNIFRFTFQDALQRQPLINKALQAGVQKAGY